MNPYTLLIPLTAALVVALGSLVVQPSGGSANPAIENEEMKFFILLNQYRADNGLAPLQLQSQLIAAADWMATDMIVDQYFSHTDNENPPRNVSTRLRDFGYSGSGAEVIAAQFLSGSDVLCGWQESGGHNNQLLNDDWEIVGIGRALRYNNSGYITESIWVVDFGRGAGSNVPTPSVSPPTPYCPYSGYTPTPVGQTPAPTPTFNMTPTLTPTATATASGGVTFPPTEIPSATPTSSPTPTPSPSPTPAEPPTYRWDDFDCSGAVDSGDPIQIIEFSAGFSQGLDPDCLTIGHSITIDGQRRTWGDTDCSLAPTILDSIKLLRYLSGLEYTTVDPSCPAPGTGVWLN